MTLEILTSDRLGALRHGFFTRRGGASSGVFSGLNCGTGSSDLSEIVAINRARVAEAMDLGPEALVAVHQTHSADVVTVAGPLDEKPRADAMVTATPGLALTILTADCQPVLFADPGAGAASEDPALLGAFKTPGLRNITRTAPYFHAGQFDTLDQVVGFYNDTRGHAAPEGQALRIHWHIHMTDGPTLSDATMQDIVAFLGALEDETLRPERPLRLPSGLPPAPAE